MKMAQKNEKPKTKVAVKERTKTFLKLPKTKQEVITDSALKYEVINQQEKLLESQRKTLRPILEDAVKSFGIEDQNGSFKLILEKDGHQIEVCNIKRVYRSLNNFAAESLLKRKGLYDSCVVQVISEEIDEERLIEAYEAGQLTAEDLDEIFTEKESWALQVKTDHPDVESIRKIRKNVEQSANKMEYIDEN